MITAYLVDLMTTIPFADGLRTLWETIRDDYLQWIFLAAVAGFAIYFIKDRKWMQLLSFAGIAAIVGVLIFAGKDLFGSGGSITGAATDVASEIQGTGGKKN